MQSNQSASEPSELDKDLIPAVTPRFGDFFWLLLARWFGCGLFPKAPGTVGTLGTLPLFFLIKSWSPVYYWGLTAALCLVGVAVSDRAAHLLGKKDPSEVVIDEAAGVLIALGAVVDGPLWLQALAVVLFRVFDILKPGPIYKMQYWKPYGLGIMIDDIAAGVVAGALCLGFAYVV